MPKRYKSPTDFSNIKENQRTRILFVIGSLNVGGAERHLLQILPKLVDHDFNPRVFTLGQKGKLAKDFQACGVEVVSPMFEEFLSTLPSILRKPLFLVSASVSYVVLNIRWRPTVIHFFLPAAYLFGGVLNFILGESIVVMSRRSLNCYQRKNKLMAWIERLLHGSMNAILGNSRAVMINLESEGAVKKHLALIYNGIELPQVNAIHKRNIIRKDLHLDDKCLLLICVANLIPYKGHLDLIQALSLIKNEMPHNWNIFMVGRDSGIKDYLVGISIALGISAHIIWLGERIDAKEIFYAADIGVLCSHEEGFSNSVLEGMGAGIPMIVTDVGGNPEAVINQECGLVVPASDIDRLGQAILYLVKNQVLRKEMGACALRRVTQEFSLDGCVNRYASLYRGLLLDSKCNAQEAIDSAKTK